MAKTTRLRPAPPRAVGRGADGPAPLPPHSPGLPPELTARLLDDADRLAGAMARRLAEEVPLPPAFRNRTYLRLVTQTCREGLGALLRQLHDGTRPTASELAGLGRAGARQAQLDVPLEVLLHAYRLAAKVVWSEVLAEAVRRQELPPAAVVAVSELVLQYLDEISGAVGRSYLETRERLVRQRDRDRDHLLQRLLAGDASPELRRLAAARELDLTPPFRVLACAVEAGVDADRVLAGAWWPAAPLLVADAPGVWIALVAAAADPAALARDGERAVAAVIGDEARRPLVRLGVGPVAATLEEVAAAAGAARRTLAAGRRLEPSRSVHDARELGLYAVLAGAQEELRAHVDRVLGPLLVADRGQRSLTLLETLAAVLGEPTLQHAAGALGVHRHTVVYRVGRLRELLGVDVEDPTQRHRLWLALQAARLLES